jgi:2'-5' RNA ligase
LPAVSAGPQARQPESVRLFLALDLPEEARAALARWRDAVLASRSELRPVADAGLHVTLTFLGRRPSEEVQRIWDVTLGALARREAPGLALASATWIPPRRPRLLAVELSDDDGRAGGVHEALSRALVKEGLYQPERRPFWPHVTVARARGRAKVRQAELAAPSELAFTAGQVTLYRSDLHPSGSRYVALERLTLPVAAG